jgi:hypothetical protein
VSPAGTDRTLMEITIESSNLAASDPITIDDEAPNDMSIMGSGIGTNLAVCRDDSVCDFRPTPGALSSYDGEDPTGTWRVCFGDKASISTGFVGNVRLRFEVG